MPVRRSRTGVSVRVLNGGSRGAVRVGFVLAMSIAVLGFSPGEPRAAADDSVCGPAGQSCAFYSPSHRIDCEIHTGDGTGPDSVYCKTVEPPQSVQMDNTGTFQPCSGISCIGNAGQGIPTLQYGQSTSQGPFTCLSEADGMTCTAAGGRGFKISTRGIAAVG